MIAKNKMSLFLQQRRIAAIILQNYIYLIRSTNQCKNIYELPKMRSITPSNAFLLLKTTHERRSVLRFYMVQIELNAMFSLSLSVHNFFRLNFDIFPFPSPESGFQLFANITKFFKVEYVVISQVCVQYFGILSGTI